MQVVFLSPLHSKVCSPNVLQFHAFPLEALNVSWMYTQWALCYMVFIRLIFWTYWSSAAVACPLRGLTHVFRDALLHTTVVMCGYLHCCHFPVSFDQPSPSPQTRDFCRQNYCPLDVFLFFAPCFANSWDCCASAVSEILKPPSLASTIIPHSKSLRSHVFSILIFCLKNSWTSWPCLHACMHLVAVTGLADNKLVYRSI